MRNSNEKAVSLIAAIGIMLIISVLSAVMASMLGVTSRGVLDNLRSSQAFGIAQGGLNWYMKQLADTTNWTTTTNQANVSLGQGTFDVALSNKASPYADSTTNTRMDISVTGKITGTDSVTIQRAMSQRVFKLPSAIKFALFWGRDVANFSFTNTAVSGDFWSIGTTSIPAGSVVTNGSAYRPTTEDITGAGTYTEVNVGAFPYFSNFSGSTLSHSTPPFNTAYYAALISDYNSREAACVSGVDINQNTSLVLTGNTLCCRDFNTNNTITISGNGYIVANRDILLHSANGDSGTLTFSPSGGSIVLIAGRDILINSNQADTPVIMNSGVRMYSKSEGINTGEITIRNDTTAIDVALILSNRNILVQNSANTTNSTLFLNDPGSATNNVLTITSAGTSVGTISGPCSVISIGRGTPSLQVTTTAGVTGLIYQRDTNNLGRTNISGTNNANRVSIMGSIIANAFSGNNISNANITYDSTAIPDPPPEGFDGFAAKKANSWSGN